MRRRVRAAVVLIRFSNWLYATARRALHRFDDLRATAGSKLSFWVLGKDPRLDEVLVVSNTLLEPYGLGARVVEAPNPANDMIDWGAVARATQNDLPN